MSIDEKARAYDNILEKARKWYNANTNAGYRSIFEDIFPELKEPKDEKIKEALVALVKCNERNGYTLLNNVSTSSMLAWLEKQGKTNIQNNKPFKIESDKFYFCIKDYFAGGCYRSRKGDIVLAQNGMNMMGLSPKEASEYFIPINPFKEKAVAWFEKQSDKPQGKSALEALQEERVDNANKVEPKFKEGDWVVFNGLTLYINEVVKGYYRTISKSGTPNSYDWNIDNAARLWTIKDAKDGDVLFHSDSASNGIFIFKELLKYEFGEKVICYCDYDSEDHFCLGEHHTCCWADAKILHPATKEQRETLFEKMKLEGYRWDEDEKKVIRFERFVRREESDFAFKEDENGVIKFVHEKN